MKCSPQAQTKAFKYQLHQYTDNMNKHSLLILIIVILLNNSVFASVPPSPDQEKRADEQVTLCESTGGIAKKEYVGGYDPQTGIDMAGGIVVDCDCPSGFSWSATEGCTKTETSTENQDNTLKTEPVSVQKQDNAVFYLGIGALIVFIFAIIFWKV